MYNHQTIIKQLWEHKYKAMQGVAMQNQNLNYILEIHKASSISKAAERLGISQPALSAHIKKVEEQLGNQIFDRSVKPIQLTEAGEIYIQYMKKQMELDKELAEKLSDLASLKRGTLSIGGATFFNVSYLPNAVGRFLSQYPGIDISIIDGSMPEIVAKALDNEVDLFIAPSWNLDRRCCYEKILHERVFVCVPPQWSMNDKLQDWKIPPNVILNGGLDDWMEQRAQPCVDFFSFREEPFILLRNDQHIGNMMSRLFERHGFEPKHYITAEQTMTSYALTLAGAGISLVTEGTLANGNLKEFPAFYLTDTDICVRDLLVAYPKQKYLSRASREFISILKDSLGAVS